MQHSRKHISILVFFCIGQIFISFSCRDNGLEYINSIEAGKRNYVWSIDTLAYPGSMQTLMIDIWGSNPNDIYVVGHNDQPGPGTMFHYDGNRWTTTHFHASDGGTITGAVSLAKIYGLSSSDIYVVGEEIYSNPTPPPNIHDSSLIIHFNGSTWKKMPISKMRRLNAVWGASPNDVWAGGLYGSLYHYDGTAFSKVWLDSTVSFARIAGFSSSNIYATATRIVDFASPLDSSKYLLYHYDGHEWSIIDSCLVTSSGTPYTFGQILWSSPQRKLYSSGYGLFRWNYTGWEKLFDSTWPIHVFGSSESNMFTVSEIGEVKHWNGSNWIHVNQIEDPGKILIGGWTNNIETFIFGYDGYKTFIIHGR